VRIPQLRIDVDYERAALYGLTPATVTQALETMSNGRTCRRSWRATGASTW
jgi:HME family heavy-metal exporter